MKKLSFLLGSQILLHTYIIQKEISFQLTKYTEKETKKEENLQHSLSKQNKQYKKHEVDPETL